MLSLLVLSSSSCLPACLPRSAAVRCMNLMYAADLILLQADPAGGAFYQTIPWTLKIRDKGRASKSFHHHRRRRRRTLR